MQRNYKLIRPEYPFALLRLDFLIEFIKIEEVRLPLAIYHLNLQGLLLELDVKHLLCDCRRLELINSLYVYSRITIRQHKKKGT